MDEDDLATNGNATATDSPSEERKKFLRSDGRAPYDMRQVSVSSWQITYYTTIIYNLKLCDAPSLDSKTRS